MLTPLRIGLSELLRVLLRIGRRVVGKRLLKMFVLASALVAGRRMLPKVVEYIRRYFGPYIRSVAIHWSSTMASDTLRAKFRSIEIPTERVSGAHTHPLAAAGRSTANIALDELALTTGYLPYSVSMSARDARSAGMSGSRLFHFAKDMAMAYRNDPITTRHLVKMVDVDYYVHMPDYLRYGQPVVLYTFNPLNVAGSLPDGSYTITDDQVQVKINGGASYAHPIWDYETDCLVSDHWWGSIIYLVEHRVLNDATRRIVGLFPVRKVYGPWAWFLPGHRLQRRVFNQGGVNLSRYQRNVDGVTQVFTSFGIPGERTCVTLTEPALKTAVVRCSLAKAPSISDVERVFREAQVTSPTYAASLFMQVWLFNPTALRGVVDLQSVGIYAGDGHTYQSIGPLVTEDGTPSVRKIGPALVDGGVAPARSYNNDVACVNGRLAAVKNDMPSAKVPPFYRQCRAEFVNFLIPGELVHTGVPWVEAEVEQMQARATQRALADRAKPFAFLHKFLVKSFQKAEVYAKVCAPRNISTTPTDHKLRYSAFVYALKQVTKRNDWYAFSKTPRELSELVRRLAGRATSLVPTDFSKFDGTHCEFLCEFELMVLLRYFAVTYHAEVARLYKDQYDAPAITKHEVRYKTGKSRLSGSAETSEFNTDDNALVAYIALRHLMSSPEEAWAALGLYGGDDGLSANIPALVYERVATRLGLALKVEVKRPGDPVPFLGRVFLDPWSSDESICDIPRRLKTLHLTTCPAIIPDSEVLTRKAISYLITDPHTPIISNWANAILRIVVPPTRPLNEHEENIVRKDVSWFAQWVDQFNVPADDSLRMWDVAAILCDKTAVEVRALCDHLDAATTLDGMSPPTLWDMKPKVEIPAVLAGEVRLPEPKAEPPRGGTAAGRGGRGGPNGRGKPRPAGLPSGGGPKRGGGVPRGGSRPSRPVQKR